LSKIWTDLSYVLLQCTRLTEDGQTDRILIVRPLLHSMQRGKSGVISSILKVYGDVTVHV